MNVAFEKFMTQPFIKNTPFIKFWKYSNPYITKKPLPRILNIQDYIQSKIHQMSCYMLRKNTMVKCLVERWQQAPHISYLVYLGAHWICGKMFTNTKLPTNCWNSEFFEILQQIFWLLECQNSSWRSKET